MNGPSRDRVYSVAEIEARLRDLPHWRLEGGWIRRRYRTRGWKETLMVINAVGYLAEAAWHHPDIAASYDWVEVRLKSHDAEGITDRDFELAGKIDALVLWRPGDDQSGALRGPPERFALLERD